jgi:ribosomal protein S18 acetylase RimI-like enzyme
VELRLATPGDEHAVAAVHVRAWQHAYRGLIPDSYLDSLVPEDRASRYTFGEHGPGSVRTVLATEGDALCGFSTTGPCRDADRQRHGELYALYVAPECLGRGVGRLLIQDARRRLQENGFAQAILWVVTGNVRAERFYRIDGWLPDGRTRLDEIHGATVDEARYTRALV